MTADPGGCTPGGDHGATSQVDDLGQDPSRRGTLLEAIAGFHKLQGREATTPAGNPTFHEATGCRGVRDARLGSETILVDQTAAVAVRIAARPERQGPVLKHFIPVGQTIAIRVCRPVRIDRDGGVTGIHRDAQVAGRHPDRGFAAHAVQQPMHEALVSGFQRDRGSADHASRWVKDPPIGDSRRLR